MTLMRGGVVMEVGDACRQLQSWDAPELTEAKRLCHVLTFENVSFLALRQSWTRRVLLGQRLSSRRTLL